MASTSSLVSELRKTANSFASGVNTQAAKMKTALEKIDVTVKSVEQKMSQLREDIVRGEESAIAQENVLHLDQKINAQLDGYIQTRRSVLGVIKDFDINLARESTISRLSDELWMSSSRYWLSSAFIAISAWVQNNKELCANAVSEAVRRDPTRTSLFFCLLNLRFGKRTESRSWLYEFFGSIDSLHPPRETALLVQSYIYGVFGRDTQLDSVMQTTMNKWISEIGADKETSAELIEDYYDYIKSLPVKNPEVKSDALYEYCDNLKDLENSYKNASRFNGALKRIKELDGAPAVKVGTGDFVEKVDKLLDDLVNSYDEEEQRLRNEMKYYQLIREHKGDKEAAKAAYEKYVEKFGDDNANISRQMFRWAVYPENEDESVQKYAMQKTKDWYCEAVRKYDRDIKSQMPNDFSLSIDLWSDVVDGKDRAAIHQSMHDKFMEARSKEIIFTKRNIILSALAVVFLIVGCVFAMICQAAGASWFFVGYIVGPVLFVAFAAIVIFTTLNKVKVFPQRIENAKRNLDKCFDEIENYRAAIERELNVKDNVLRMLDNL